MSKKRQVLTVVMDGVGLRDSDYGNAVKLAQTPWLDQLQRIGRHGRLHAHGTWVGLPEDKDMGNSEVGHNALGAGRIFDQGAKLVDQALSSGSLFEGHCWRELLAFTRGGTLHFCGLVSDGNVHSHEQHLFAMMRAAAEAGVGSIRVHALLDGRDVGEKSAEVYVERLEKELAGLRQRGCDARVASGGGRMTTTMDRYEADWSMVERGWRAHVLGEADQSFASLEDAVATFRRADDLTDQYFPAFVIKDADGPVGRVRDGDGFVFFNFRGDRAIEISRAFTEPEFRGFDRGSLPDVFYAGMMEYDGDLHIPPRYLVEPPAIDHTLGEFLADAGLRQFACSETQKYGHVTYFWNGNRSGKFRDDLEEYCEIPSDEVPFHLKPWMKAREITDTTIARMEAGSFDFGRINYANGDMVGHTGKLEAAVIAMATVDLMLGELLAASRRTGHILVITADHGNCDEMFDVKKTAPVPQNWLQTPPEERPPACTTHTLNPVPFIIFDPRGETGELAPVPDASLGNVAATILELMGEVPPKIFMPSLLGGANHG